MKNLIIIILFLFSVNTFSQKLNGFKFVYVAPIEYNNGSQDYWGIEAQTKRFFGKLGYEILNTINERNSVKNKCEILDIAIGHTNILPPQSGYNTVNFNLYDCNGSFTTFSDKAMTFTAQGDFSRATKKALKWFLEKKIKKYSFDSSFTPILKVAKVKQNKDLNSFGQFEMQRNIKYTNYFNQESIKDYWKNSNQEFDDLEGIYEPLVGGGISVLEYVLGIIKVDDYYEIIMLGKPYGSSDVNIGGVKATAKKMPAKGVYNMRWRMANARNIEKGFIIKENSVITTKFTKYPKSNDAKYVKTFDPISLTSNTKKPIGWAGNGSGVIISKSGHIITNHHVIEDAEKIEVEFMLDDELQKFNAEVIQVDKTNDLAVLKIFDMNFDGIAEPPYNFKFRGSDVGTKVYAFGYPMALTVMGKEIKVTDGMISSKSGFDGDITTYQITAPIQGGNSGGPLFDEQANLIGINSSGIRKDIADNVAYSIKTSYVSNLLDVLPKSIELPSSTRLKSLPLTEQIKEISKYVVLVKVK